MTTSQVDQVSKDINFYLMSFLCISVLIHHTRATNAAIMKKY